MRLVNRFSYRNITLDNYKYIIACFCIILAVSITSTSCSDKRDNTRSEDKPHFVVKKRADGTISTISQVDSAGIINGNRVSYFEDGKTLYSKHTYVNGLKNGPSVYYYKNGQLAQSSNYANGKKHGITRKYYKSGKKLAVYEHMHGKPIPGLKEYKEGGSLITAYPEVNIREINLLSSKNRIDLEIACTMKSNSIKYYLQEEKDGKENRIYIISEKGALKRQFFIKPGNTLNTSI